MNINRHVPMELEIDDKKVFFKKIRKLKIAQTNDIKLHYDVKL